MRIPERLHTSSGFTITELLIATGLVSVFFLIGSSVITQLFSFQSDVSRLMMDNFSVVNFHRSVTKDLEGSYWSRYGAFTCPSSQSLLTTLSTSTKKLSASNGLVEFVTADFATSVGSVPGTTKISVATMRNLQVNDLVVLSMASDMSNAGLYKITSVDRAKDQVQLDISGLSVSGSECASLLSSRPLTEFFGASAQSNVIMTRIKVVRYAVQKGQLLRTVMPGGGEEKVVDGVKALNITSSWTMTSYDDSEKDASVRQARQRKYGVMKFDMTLDYDRKTMMGGDAAVREQQTLTAQYNLDSFQYMNSYAKTGAPTVMQKFPTCAVNYNFRPGVLNISPDGSTATASFNNMVPVSITGYSSEGGLDGATIDISFATEPGAAISCYLHNPDHGSYPTNGYLDKPKNTGAITLNNNATFDVYTCAVKGTVSVNASMSYYSQSSNRVTTIRCSTDDIVAPTKYRFSGGKPSCNKKWAYWDMGSEIVSADGAQALSWGRMSLDMQTSCVWEGSNPSASEDTGKKDDCYSWNHPGKDLLRIYLRPYKQQVLKSNGLSNAFDSDGAYIDCE